MPSSSAQNDGQSDARSDTVRRDILPIPDLQHIGLTTYDAKDPDTRFPPIEPIRRLLHTPERVASYRGGYEAYYQRCATPADPPMRDPNPIVVLVPGIGRISFAADQMTARLAGEFRKAKHARLFDPSTSHRKHSDCVFLGC